MLSSNNAQLKGDEVPVLIEEHHCQRGKGDEEDRLSEVGASRLSPFLGSG